MTIEEVRKRRERRGNLEGARDWLTSTFQTRTPLRNLHDNKSSLMSCTASLSLNDGQDSTLQQHIVVYDGFTACHKQLFQW